MGLAKLVSSVKNLLGNNLEKKTRTKNKQTNRNKGN
jgi:hypothetical protein